MTDDPLQLISIDPAVCHGQARVEGTRIVAKMLQRGSPMLRPSSHPPTDNSGAGLLESPSTTSRLSHRTVTETSWGQRWTLGTPPIVVPHLRGIE